MPRARPPGAAALCAAFCRQPDSHHRPCRRAGKGARQRRGHAGSDDHDLSRRDYQGRGDREPCLLGACHRPPAGDRGCARPDRQGGTSYPATRAADSAQRCRGAASGRTRSAGPGGVLGRRPDHHRAPPRHSKPVRWEIGCAARNLDSGVTIIGKVQADGSLRVGE